MNRNFIFVSLLATLSTVNTIPHQLYNRTNTFGPCSKAPPETVLLNVVLSPDPVIAGKNDTFTIDAKFNVEVTTSTKYTECPVLPGTEMTAKVPVPAVVAFVGEFSPDELDFNFLFTNSFNTKK
ncbi:hypothetical protein GLOIN_2v1776710 [Rhizophagus irregularis DAOM 181602=DAOM 197198]|uniref:Phosphatidylglycerol/phosphatidylinositol transfer protein n=2 Tax=Rhizophagus irregularis TaxID=588596 RepID=A0A2N1NF29_9GLOM|nr:hypothetical protein GLOIN_2v1776710 [Rhizophagus irregularis DAOM 181602=DAOM 197198]PKK72496.1 hypothetical protein RhiirC2_777142 [Rhizophagus irregularis]POG69724.1 hypothetical protein GLOIN_2v1776710 [Rhizophagus irregularis DAOM 181602=DAOM 197198]|eukprot:XP_025176590.1 hypothetical protein GLOIN_2v1776710 [Rhizophagus irregularis DAOM 181602=DAOM 197198]